MTIVFVSPNRLLGNLYRLPTYVDVQPWSISKPLKITQSFFYNSACSQLSGHKETLKSSYAVN